MILLASAAELDDGVLDHLAARLPAQRRERAARFLRPVDRASNIVAHALLDYGWSRVSREALPSIATGRWGKPRFAAPTRWQFNLSHDSGVCVCVMSRSAVGVDVQSRVPFDEGLLSRFAAPAELGHTANYRAADDVGALWTRKEALVKRMGRGIGADLREIDTTRVSDLHTIRSEELGMHLSVSARGIAETPPVVTRLTWGRSGWMPQADESWQVPAQR